MEEIVKRAKNGEIRALEELIHINEVKLYKTARSILADNDDIEEAIQQTIILVYKNIYKLKKEKYFTTWMMRILINECKKIWNQNSKRDKMFSDLEDHKEIVEKEQEDYGFVTKALNGLDKEFREVTILYYYDEFSVKEISKILNLPQGTVKSRLARARLKLNDLIKKEEM